MANSKRSWNFDTNDSVEFTKFPVGITKIRILEKAPHIRWIHWLDSLRKSITCPGKGCPICEIRKEQKENKEQYSYNMTRRFSINIINRETGKQEIMEQGITFFQDLKDIAEEQDIESVELKVKRRGKGVDDTSYRIDVEEVAELSESDEKMKESKIDLEEYFTPATPKQIQRLINGEEWKEVMSNNEENSKENVEEVEIS